MGEKTDKIIAAGAGIATTVSLWDRITGWWSRRKIRKAEDAAVRKYEDDRRDEHQLNLASDEANWKIHGRPCSAPGCERPKFHSRCGCGMPPCPGDHGPKLKPWRTS